MKPRALILDFDGLIVDTEVPIFESWQTDFADFGHELNLEEYVGCVGSDLNGFDPHSHLEELTGKTINRAELEEAREDRIHAAVDQLGPMDGVREVLEEAHEEGIPCAVASSSPRSWVEKHLDRIGFMKHFVLTRTIDDVSAPKPSPELFLAAAAGLDVDPEEAIVFEDSLNGLRASVSAGSPCVVVPNQITTHLEFTEATRRVDSMEHVSVPWLRNIFTTQ